MITSAPCQGRKKKHKCQKISSQLVFNVTILSFGLMHTQKKKPRKNKYRLIVFVGHWLTYSLAKNFKIPHHHKICTKFKSKGLQALSHYKLPLYSTSQDIRIKPQISQHELTAAKKQQKKKIKAIKNITLINFILKIKIIEKDSFYLIQ